MDTERLLSVTAIMRAYVTNDHKGFEALVKSAPETGYGDLLAFATMLIEYHTGEPALAYLDRMANSLVSIACDEAARQN